MRILAVDISNLFSIHWEINQGNEDSHAHQATLRAIAAARDGFDRVAICCDAGRSWRRQVWPEYKAARPERAAGYKFQLERTVEQLRREGCTIFVAPPVNMAAADDGTCFYAEADDVIGSLCAWATEGGHGVRVLSGDKDLLQLVQGDSEADDTWVERCDHKGTVMRPADVEAKLGVSPTRVPDWLALAGDKSDGYKPFPGLGDIKAVALIKFFGSAQNVFEPENLARAHEVVGDAVAKTLRADGAAKRASQCLLIATIMRDLVIDFAPLLTEPVYERPVPRVDFAPAATAVQAVPEPQQAAQEATVASRQDALPQQPPAPQMVKRAAIESYAFNPFALEPADPKQALDLAVSAHHSSLFKKFPNESAMLMVILEGRALGVPAVVSLKNAYIVKGNVGWSARFLRGLVMKSSLCEYFEIVESDMNHALAICKRVGRPEFQVLSTTELARQRGLIKAPGQNRSGQDTEGNKWFTDPLSMNMAEVERRGARMGWPDVVAGLYTPDELEMGRSSEGIDILEAA